MMTFNNVHRCIVPYVCSMVVVGTILGVSIGVGAWATALITSLFVPISTVLFVVGSWSGKQEIAIKADPKPTSLFDVPDEPYQVIETLRDEIWDESTDFSTAWSDPVTMAKLQLLNARIQKDKHGN